MSKGGLLTDMMHYAFPMRVAELYQINSAPIKYTVGIDKQKDNSAVPS